MLVKFIGDRAFYRKLFSVMLPILIQNLITNFVNLLDNVMVGQVGTEPMSGVAIVNQLLFVFNLCIFGGLAGAGIFTSQFYGKNDSKGVRDTMRMMLWIAAGILLVFGSLLLFCGPKLIGLFLHEGKEDLDLAATLAFGESYLRVMLLQLIPFAVTQIYASTLRRTGETVLPMRAGITAVLVNLSFNYILIFGKLGFPALGVIGAAIATVLARMVEMLIVVIWAHRHTDRLPFLPGVYSSLRVPWELARQVLLLGMPLLINELLWSGGMTVLNQCYSLRGLEVVSAFNISSTIGNLFFCVFIATGDSISILIGRLLGAGELERAVDEDRKLIAFSALLSLFVAVAAACIAAPIPRLYNTTESVRLLATRLLLIWAVLTPLHAFANACYFTLRSGGKTLITFAFDSLFLWVFQIPLAFCLSRYTGLPILQMYALVESMNLIKCLIGAWMLKSRMWVVNLVQ
ncbi:MAG: MATE family efflux transporter [Oscillospiraceae bacterium]|nr:MATE family efflux transporter [Oscillospiraceae bacterium]